MESHLTYVRDQLEKIQQYAPNGQSYWEGRKLMEVLNYKEWRSFQEVIERAMQACEMSGNFRADHFVPFPELVEGGSGAKLKRENWKLSRYACYLVTMNGDPSKPEIASAQTYFTVQTYRQESQDRLGEEERRLLLRARVKDANRKLGGAAKDAGVRSAMFGVFQDAGYKGLYGGIGVRAIKNKKGIGDKEDLLDCIGRAELAANEFRITQTEEKLRIEDIKGEQRAIDTHLTVGKRVRQAIKDIGGTMPELLPAEPSIKKLVAKKAKSLKGSVKPPNES
jgi:DNA-damage-inducible protein D